MKKGNDKEKRVRRKGNKGSLGKEWVEVEGVAIGLIGRLGGEGG